MSPDKKTLTFTTTIETKYQTILTADACSFLQQLIEQFQPELDELLASREQKQIEYDQGKRPNFLVETQEIREGDWHIAPLPEPLTKRCVEITGPVDRKMVINALNTDVNVFMADFEDSQSPTWEGMMDGQINLRDANSGKMTHKDPQTGKSYQLKDQHALLMARVRGLHLVEKHIYLDDRIAAGCLVDFALYFFHNYHTRLQKGLGVYLYLPKLQSHQEAAWWAKIFHFTERLFQIPTGSIRATVLIETLPAVFEMDEILYAMRDHIAGLNCGRWDYIFSYIKTLKQHADRILPDRQSVTMAQPFLSAYSKLLVQTCHRRGALAMGGMAALIPSKDPDINKTILAKVRQDKLLELDNGHDGTWIAHPGLAPTVNELFSNYLHYDAVNQLHKPIDSTISVTQEQLLAPCSGDCTEEGMRHNIRVALQYIAAWISGKGCVPIYGLMEDAATAEISRASIWQWIHHQQVLTNGKIVNKNLFIEMLDEEAQQVLQEVGEVKWNSQRFDAAKELLTQITTSETFVDFITLPGYSYI